jgi:hypothetical protein
LRDRFCPCIKRRKRPRKPLIGGSSVRSGVGNIHAGRAREKVKFSVESSMKAKTAADYFLRRRFLLKTKNKKYQASRPFRRNVASQHRQKAFES